ncbi:hypothetical protein KSP40_PGU000801 [Platanthera guangdongensis]|uniref:phosphatidylserine decarboxylase n=1 Tax=Platanthera guangdongensis TaxID=2320717 RepID=A0ABR2MJP6_9ASPA
MLSSAGAGSPNGAGVDARQHERHEVLVVREWVLSSMRAQIPSSAGADDQQREDMKPCTTFLLPLNCMGHYVMDGVLHARRLFDNSKVDEMKEKGIEPEFSPDAKAAFLKLLPLRSISRLCGYITSLEIAVWLRPSIYKAWARAFHAMTMNSQGEKNADRVQFGHGREGFLVIKAMLLSKPPCHETGLQTVDSAIRRMFNDKDPFAANRGVTSRKRNQSPDLEEAALPLEEYATLQEFFSRSLKNGSRPIDQDPYCLVSPVDATVLRFGELEGPGTLIEQVKGFSYSAYSLLGATTSLHEVVDMDTLEEPSEHSSSGELNKSSWWRISLASPKVRHPVSSRPTKGVFYCVLYLRPGDYHRVHSPTDWQVLIRRHFSGHLFPLNQRATRTIRNLYIENERVVLEGQWSEGFMAMVAIGATNIGSIKLYIEPELKTNRPERQMLLRDPPDVKAYEPKGIGLAIKKGAEVVAAFKMGSTVVLVFQAPASGFHFCVRRIVCADWRLSLQARARVRLNQARSRFTSTILWGWLNMYRAYS